MAQLNDTATSSSVGSRFGSELYLGGRYSYSKRAPWWLRTTTLSVTRPLMHGGAMKRTARLRCRELRRCLVEFNQVWCAVPGPGLVRRVALTWPGPDSTSTRRGLPRRGATWRGVVRHGLVRESRLDSPAQQSERQQDRNAVLWYPTGGLRDRRAPLCI
jgi:hypothetical protein